MSLIRQSLAQAKLAPYIDVLRACVEAAWAHWMHVLPHFPVCPSRTRRAVMHAFILQEVQARFGDMPGVKMTETRQGRFLVLVEGIVLLFKHVDGRLIPANYRTPGAIAFNQQLPLTGIPKGPRLVIGYRLNLLETELAAVHVIYLVGDEVMWDYEIGKDGGTVVELFPETPQGPRVTPKRPPKESPKHRPKKADDTKSETPSGE